MLVRKVPAQARQAQRRRSVGRDGLRFVCCQLRRRPRALAARTSRKLLRRDVPYTPAWAESITGVPRDQIITVAREFARNAEKTHGRSMVIIGAAMNHWYHMRHELSRHHQHAGDVRLRRPVRRRLVALRRSGKAAPANRLAAAGVRARLEPAAAPKERDLVLLCPHRPVALRNARRIRNALPDRARRSVGRRDDRLQRARRAHGLVAVRAATGGQSADYRRRAPAAGPWSRKTTSRTR